MDNKKAGNVMALIPVGVFLILYLGTGVYFEYISPGKDRMGFYVISVVVAFSIALVVAFLQNRKKTFEEKIHLCAMGIGDDNIVIMLFIFPIAEEISRNGNYLLPLFILSVFACGVYGDIDNKGLRNIKKGDQTHA